MAQEEQNHRGSTTTSGGCGGNISSLGRSSRRQKKVPQRGLGVAQLEKIRIEELQKKDAAAAALVAPAILPPSPPHLSQGTVPLMNPGKADVIELGRHSDTIATHRNVQNMWTPAHLGPELETTAMEPSYVHLGPELETTAMEPSYVLRPNWNLQCEPDPVWPPPAGPIPRVQLDYLNQVHAAVVHSTPPSTSLNYHMEPPSNQNYHHGYYIPVAPEVNLLKRDVVQVVGMKRPSPFCLENPLAPPPLRPRTAHQIGPSNEPISHGNGSSSMHEPGRGNSRNEYENGPSLSGSNSEPDTNSTRGLRANGILGEVLVLAPPSTSSTWPNPRPMTPAATLASSNHNNFRDLDPQGPHPHYQGRAEEVDGYQQGSRRPSGQHHYYYNFLPPAIPQDARADTSLDPGHRKDQEPIDLELRL